MTFKLCALQSRFVSSKFISSRKFICQIELFFVIRAPCKSSAKQNKLSLMVFFLIFCTVDGWDCTLVPDFALLVCLWQQHSTDFCGKFMLANLLHVFLVVLSRSHYFSFFLYSPRGRQLHKNKKNTKYCI